MRRKIIRSALIAFGLLIAVLAAYVIYVFADYHRFEDRLVLTPEGEASALFPIMSALARTAQITAFSWMAAQRAARVLHRPSTIISRGQLPLPRLTSPIF